MIRRTEQLSLPNTGVASQVVEERFGGKPQAPPSGKTTAVDPNDPPPPTEGASHEALGAYWLPRTKVERYHSGSSQKSWTVAISGAHVPPKAVLVGILDGWKPNLGCSVTGYASSPDGKKRFEVVVNID